MGTITNSIGSAGGRDYSTVALWEAALPANIVTAGNSYIGQCYNDSEFLVAGTIVNISGITTDSSHTITLTTGPGQSFRDNANVQTNALRYNVANGVGLRGTSNTATALIVDNDWVYISNLQVRYDGTGNYGAASCAAVRGVSAYTADGPFIDDCIFAVNNAGFHGNLGKAVGLAHMCNCVLILGGGNYSGSCWTTGNQGGVYANNTFVVPSDRGPSNNTQYGIEGNQTYHGTLTITNCCSFGTKNGFSDATTNASGSNNATDGSSVGFGSSNLTSLTYSSQFPNTTFASGDFKLKTGSNLIDAGATDTTDIPSAIDIVGTSRPQASAWDIGCWELVQAAVFLGIGWWRPVDSVITAKRNEPPQQAFVAQPSATVGISGNAWMRQVENVIAAKRYEPPPEAYVAPLTVTVGIAGMAWWRPFEHIFAKRVIQTKDESWDPRAFVPISGMAWYLQFEQFARIAKAQPPDLAWALFPTAQAVGISGMAWHRQVEQFVAKTRIEPPPEAYVAPLTVTVGIGGMAWHRQVEQTIASFKIQPADLAQALTPIIPPTVSWQRPAEEIARGPRPQPADIDRAPFLAQPIILPWLDKAPQPLSPPRTQPSEIRRSPFVPAPPVGISGMAWHREVMNWLRPPQPQNETGVRAMFVPPTIITFPDPRFGSFLGSRLFASFLPYRSFASILGWPMPQGPDLGQMDVGETGNSWIDFARWLPTGVTIASISSVSVSNYLPSTGSPNAALTGGASISTASAAVGGSGVGNTAVLQQVTGLIAGDYRLDITITTSDGQTLNGWAHGTVSTPN